MDKFLDEEMLSFILKEQGETRESLGTRIKERFDDYQGFAGYIERKKKDLF